MAIRRVAVCVTQVPFSRGGAEEHAEGLVDALIARGFESDLIRLPFKWYPNPKILQSCLAWRLLDLTESNGVPIDAVICLNFPSYVVSHPCKIVWLVHQYRQAYDLFTSPYSGFTDSPEDRQVHNAILTLDRRVLGEAARRFSNSGNVARRLERYSGLSATPLYPPPRHPEQFRQGPFGDYLLSAGRLDPLKRVDLLLQALACSSSGLRAVITGVGPREAELRALARQLGLAERVTFTGWISRDELNSLYAGAYGVFFAPHDEDFGYITVEAFLSGKPVITATDSGGPTELVLDGQTGYVRDPDPAELGAAIDRLAADPAHAAQLGQAGLRLAQEITWDRAVDALLGGL